MEQRGTGRPASEGFAESEWPLRAIHPDDQVRNACPDSSSLAADISSICSLSSRPTTTAHSRAWCGITCRPFEKCPRKLRRCCSIRSASDATSDGASRRSNAKPRSVPLTLGRVFRPAVAAHGDRRIGVTFGDAEFVSQLAAAFVTVEDSGSCSRQFAGGDLAPNSFHCRIFPPHTSMEQRVWKCTEFTHRNGDRLPGSGCCSLTVQRHAFRPPLLLQSAGRASHVGYDRLVRPLAMTGATSAWGGEQIRGKSGSCVLQPDRLTELRTLGFPAAYFHLPFPRAFSHSGSVGSHRVPASSDCGDIHAADCFAVSSPAAGAMRT